MPFNLVFSNHLKSFKHIINLGNGTFGKVSLYRCNHYNFENLIPNKCKNIYVVKKIKVDKKVYFKSMLNEWTLSKILDHENIRSIIDIDICNNSLIYEYNPMYIDMFEFLKKQMFILNKCNIDKFINQFKSFLNYIHDLGIAHLDLKLENILIDSEYNIKIIDFGTAQVCKLNKKTFLIKGPYTTLQYASPEQFTNVLYLPTKSDLWSFGIILICILKNSYIWQTATANDPNFCNFKKNKHGFLSSLKLDSTYFFTLYNLLDIDPTFRFI